MKAVVLAYHDMGLAGLDALKRHGFEIQAVFSHEDDPGENCWFGSVAAWAKEQAIPVFNPENVNTDRWIEVMATLKPDVIFSFYYRKLVCQRILDIPSIGAFNLHGSLLPAYRGRVPVNWALINGENKTGVTLHYMIDRADAGDIVGQEVVDIQLQDTAVMLYRKLCAAAARLLDNLLPLFKTGQIPREPQDESRATTFRARRPEDGRINWHQPARNIYNLLRAVTDPYPGAFTYLPDGEKMIVWWGMPERMDQPRERQGVVEIRETAVYVSTGEGSIRLLDVDISGRRYRDNEIYEYFKRRERMQLT